MREQPRPSEPVTEAEWAAAYPDAAAALRAMRAKHLDLPAHGAAFTVWKGQFPEASHAWAQTVVRALGAQGLL